MVLGILLSSCFHEFFKPNNNNNKLQILIQGVLSSLDICER